MAIPHELLKNLKVENLPDKIVIVVEKEIQRTTTKGNPVFIDTKNEMTFINFNEMLKGIGLKITLIEYDIEPFDKDEEKV